jgi:hypothetical protein
VNALIVPYVNFLKTTVSVSVIVMKICAFATNILGEKYVLVVIENIMVTVNQKTNVLITANLNYVLMIKIMMRNIKIIFIQNGIFVVMGDLVDNFMDMDLIIQMK